MWLVVTVSGPSEHEMRINAYRINTDQDGFDDLARIHAAIEREPAGVRLYSDAVKRLRSSKAPTFVDALVMSEFANTWARFEYRRTGGNDFKAFRNSSGFKAVAQDIALSLRSILNIAKPTGTAFANISLSPFLAAFETGGADFNDLLIVETCRSGVSW